MGAKMLLSPDFLGSDILAWISILGHGVEVSTSSGSSEDIYVERRYHVLNRKARLESVSKWFK